MGEKKKTFQMRHTANPTSASVNHRKKKKGLEQEGFANAFSLAFPTL